MSHALAVIGLVSAGLILLNGIFVAAEFSLVGATRPRLQPLLDAGRRDAHHVQALTGSLRALDRSLTAAQIGITLVSLGLGMYGEHALAEILRPTMEELGLWSGPAAHVAASAVALACLTFAHIVVGETVPKGIALQHPVGTALWIQGPLRLAMLLLAPLIFLLDRTGNALLRLLKVPVDSGEGRSHTAEEIEVLIEESGSGGALGPRLTEILLNLMDFQDLRVRKLMVPRTHIVGLPAGAGRDEVLRLLGESQHTRYPVFDGDPDHVLGFVHAKDLMRAVDAEEPFDLRRIVRPVPLIPESAPARQLLRTLREERVQLAVVLDEHGGTAGIATFEDLIEEIFGDVEDEFDEDEPRIRRLGPAAALVEGATRVDEVNEVLGLALPEEDVDTVAGLVLQGLGRTARLGDEVRVGAVKLRVDGVRRLAVTRVRVEWTEDPGS